MLRIQKLFNHRSILPTLIKSHSILSQRSFPTFIDLTNPTDYSPNLYVPMAEKASSHPQQQQQQQKPKKAKKKKLTKAERIALRESQQQKSKPSLKHPDDGDFGDIAFNQSQYRVQHMIYFSEISILFSMSSLTLIDQSNMDRFEDSVRRHEWQRSSDSWSRGHCA